MQRIYYWSSDINKLNNYYFFISTAISVWKINKNLKFCQMEGERINADLTEKKNVNYGSIYSYVLSEVNRIF